MARRFWDVIETGRRELDDFHRILREMTEPELVEFYWAHADAEAELHAAGMADHMGEAVSDNAMSRLAEWVVDQGIDYYDRAFDDFSVLPKRAPEDAILDLRGQASTFYRRRFGESMRYRDEPPRGPRTEG